MTSINVTKNKNSPFKINRDVFVVLFDHTIARRKIKFVRAFETSSIAYDDFIGLCRTAEVPYPLFFLPIEEVRKVILDYEKKVYFGVSKDQMSIATRGELKLADISLVLKDLTRKQNFIKKYVYVENELPGLFRRHKGNVDKHAKMLRKMIGYDVEVVAELNKEKSYNLLSDGLAAKNVFLSLYAHNYTPQTIEQNLQFSGIAINDKKCPFLFIKAGDNNSKIELWGRRLFTAALLLSCLCSNDCGPVTMDGKSGELVNDKHFLFAEEFLMPKEHFNRESLSSISDVNAVAARYSVSDSAVVMRAFRLGMVDEYEKDAYLLGLRLQWDAITSKKGGGKPLALEKAINRYNNPVIVELVVERYRSKILTANEAKNLLCYKKGDSFNIDMLVPNV